MIVARQPGSVRVVTQLMFLKKVTMKGTEVPNPRRISACDCTCVLTRLSRDFLMLAMCILFCSCLCKVHSRISDALSQALCNLSLAFLAS